MVLRACWLVAVLSLAACPRTATQNVPASDSTPAVASHTPSQVPPTKTPPMTDTWSPVVDGLQIQAIPPAGPAIPGSALTITLNFRNTGPELRRIYLLHSEPFRAMQSTFFLGLPTPTGLSMQPEPRPHGIVVGEADFHELPPGESRSFTQTLRLPGDLAPGTLSVRWKYSNQIDRWEGGIQTFDGPTKELFGGGPIPGIWKGEIETRFDVAVAGK
jgi:hypothetical protein